MMREAAKKYPTGKRAEAKIEKTLHEFKEGTLKSGGSDETVTNRRQAVAIALSQARRAGKRK